MTYFQMGKNLTSLGNFQLVWDGFVAWGVDFPSHWGQEKMSVSVLVKCCSSQPPWDLTALFAEGRAACKGWETQECWKRRTKVEKARIWLLFADGLFPSREQRLIVLCSHPHPWLQQHHGAGGQKMDGAVLHLGLLGKAFLPWEMGLHTGSFAFPILLRSSRAHSCVVKQGAKGDKMEREWWPGIRPVMEHFPWERLLLKIGCYNAGRGGMRQWGWNSFAWGNIMEQGF